MWNMTRNCGKVAYCKTGADNSQTRSILKVGDHTFARCEANERSRHYSLSKRRAQGPVDGRQGHLLVLIAAVYCSTIVIAPIFYCADTPISAFDCA
eukprot:IDg1682t1